MISLYKGGYDLVTKLTNKMKRFRREDTGEAVILYQIRAIKDFDIITLNGIQYEKRRIKKGTFGGFVENTVKLGHRAWIGQDAILLGDTAFSGVCTGYARIYDSVIGEGAIIAGRAIIEKSSIGNSVTISGTTSLKKSSVSDGAFVIGTAVRYSKIGEKATIKCAGVIEKEEIEKEGYRTHKRL